MSELSQPIADYLNTHSDMPMPERRIMEKIVRDNLLYMSEQELRQARYLLSRDKTPQRPN